MEFLTSLMAWFSVHGTDAGAALLSVLGLFSIIAKMTPTDSDDKIVQFLLDIVHKIGLTKSA